MNIAFFGNTLNRHQAYVADALFELTNGEYTYIETVAPTEDNKTSGKKLVERPYVFRAYENQGMWTEAMRMAREVDVALFGACSLPFEVERMRLNEPGLAFEVSERWLKRGWFNLLSPRLIRNMWHYHTGRWKDKPLYKLCSSAFGASDQYKLHSFINRCYKWGYFTYVPEAFDATINEKPSSVSGINTLMWCARFLKLKHPELPIQLALRLKAAGYSFVLNMYGEGNELIHTMSLARKLGVGDVVSFKGNLPNDNILEAMRLSDVFLFTSNRKEGWGAVLNEAMSNKCAVVASDAIGSVPFLIQDGKNGLVFNSGKIDSLFEKVRFLLDNPDKREMMANNAYLSMVNVWSPTQAAKNLLTLIDNLQKGVDSPIISGPCSKAYII